MAMYDAGDYGSYDPQEEERRNRMEALRSQLNPQEQPREEGMSSTQPVREGIVAGDQVPEERHAKGARDENLDAIQRAYQRYGQGRVDAFLKDNPNDIGRIDSAFGGGGGGGSQYTSSGGGGGGDFRTVSPFTEQLRQILMSQLGGLTRPVSASDPGIAPVLAGQRIALKRSADRKRAMEAERLAMEGLSDSGAADTSRLGIEGARGEAEAQFTGQVLHRELESRRQQLQSLMNMALASGDAESAREIQHVLAQLQNAQFQDSMAFNYNQLNSQNNLQTLLALLNAA